MNIETYIDELIANGLERNYWFMTKQTMSDYYFPYYVGYVVDSYPSKHRQDQNFARYYMECFKNNPETKELFPAQWESENTYRNAIIAEFVGLIDRTTTRYDQAKATAAYKRLSAYIKCAADITGHRYVVDRQIEKICLNVIDSARKYQEVKSVTIFPVVFLYKVLLGLYEKYSDSKLTNEEFSIFIMRTESYDKYDVVMNLIDQYRKHSYGPAYDRKIQEILRHQSTTNVRFDALFGSLSNIDYKSSEYYGIKNNQAAFDYIRTVVNLYENSEWAKTKDKHKLRNFMQSDEYFAGTIDSVPMDVSLTEEEFQQIIEKEDEFLEKLQKLAEEFGESGTTDITSEVRLPSVQKAFRDKLIEKHGQKCLLCAIQNRELLVASHIKPAVDCDIYEKADFNNGLLLCAIHDKLFDRFLITFNFYDGKMQISSSLSDVEKKTCHLSEEYVLPKEILSPERQQYLMWHNEVFQKREMSR